ncbi:MAG: damage-inducible protein [Betaproteobacteria bacterium]|nr:MAG: damage-inducible protein [Betaproteobacteria bacterium]
MRSIGAFVIGDEILTGKRADKHLPQVIATLGARGLALDYAHYVGDDRARLTALLRDTFARGDIVFSFGGIGATPDDHTRQAAAGALGVPLVPHPEAIAGIVARFGAQAYPHRVLMAEFPDGATLIPNPVNNVAAFSIRDHHFMPGFPQMAWPMMDWVLATHYPQLRREPPLERMVVVWDAGESQLLPLMSENVARFPGAKLFSLPSFVGDGGRRRLELGVRGAAADVVPAFAHLLAGVEASGFPFEVPPGKAP